MQSGGLGDGLLSHLGQPSAEGCSGHAEHRGDLPLGVAFASEGFGGANVERDSRSAGVLPVSLRPADAREDALLDEVALVGGEGSEQVEQQPSRGRRGVNARVPDGDEADAEVLQLVEHLQEVLPAAAEPVEFPHHDEVEVPATSGIHQAVECGSRCRRPAHAVIDVLGDDVPPALTGDLAEFMELKLTSWPWPVVETRA